MNNLYSVYVFNMLPSSIKKQISLYLISFGTPTSKLIKEELEGMYNYFKKKHNCANTEFTQNNIGFYGCKICYEVYCMNQYRITYQGLLNHPSNYPEQFHELNRAKISYLQYYFPKDINYKKHAHWLKEADIILRNLFANRLAMME